MLPSAACGSTTETGGKEIVEKIAGTIAAATKVGRQVTRNVSWFWRVEPRDGDSGADPLEESGEELEGGYVSQPSSPDEC
ncbi:hypothetical protein NDU88_007039 [Pleurodeles waltl]|uniref:Uncharacterized protein n=1 Tax=Pleurodeles waltl TaxID=8319 RepID=A0AAV7VRG5_PLEWA|nr:hypothetical protein NDU88_007039 [Pleurodeles waltl]